MTRPTRTFEIREDSLAESLDPDSPAQVVLAFAHQWNGYTSAGVVEALTAEELVDLHRKLTLFMLSMAGKQFLSDADITYRVKLSSTPERHPEWEVAK